MTNYWAGNASLVGTVRTLAANTPYVVVVRARNELGCSSEAAAAGHNCDSMAAMTGIV